MMWTPTELLAWTEPAPLLALLVYAFGMAAVIARAPAATPPPLRENDDDPPEWNTW